MKSKKSISFSFKPTMSIIALSVAAAFALAACGGGGDDDNNNVPPPPSNGGTVLGYVAQYGADADGVGGNILRCSVTSSTGAMTCAEADASTPAVPAASAIALAGSNMYVLSDANSATSKIYRCSISDTGALSSTCTEETGAGAELGFTLDLAASSDSVYALKAGQLQRCGVTAGAITEACGLGGMSAADEAVLAGRAMESMAFKGDRLWLVDSSGAGSVLTCAVTGGVVSGCVPAWAGTLPAEGSSDPAPAPIAIAFNSGHTNAYILQRDQNNIVKCAADSSGLLSACAAPVGLPAATGDAVANRIAVQGNYVYVTDVSSTAANNGVVMCTIEADGSVNGASCTSALPTTGTSPITSEITDLAFMTIAQ